MTDLTPAQSAFWSHFLAATGEPARLRAVDAQFAFDEGEAERLGGRFPRFGRSALGCISIDLRRP